MTFHQWQQTAQRVHAIVARIDAMYYRTANEYARKAGLGGARNTWHNAILAREAGAPWEGVDYDALRTARYWDRRRDDVSAIGRRITDRAWQRVTR